MNIGEGPTGEVYKCKNCGAGLTTKAEYCRQCLQNLAAEAKNNPGEKGLLPRGKASSNLIFTAVIIVCAVVAAFLFYQANWGSQGGQVKSEKENIADLDAANSDFTKNPSLPSVPNEAVVKIIAQDQGQTVRGTGLMFTKSGHVLTDPRLVSNKYGVPAEKIRVCLSGGTEGLDCEHEARLIDADFEINLAVIKINPAGLEINPYLLVVEEDSKKNRGKIIGVGQEVKIASYATSREDIFKISSSSVQGYGYHDYVNRDGSVERNPDRLRIEDESRFLSTGSPVFDSKNRYAGIGIFLKTRDGQEVKEVIFWNVINGYLVDLVYKDVLVLRDGQFAEREKIPAEEGLYAGYKAYVKKDYTEAIAKFEKYKNENKSDSRGVFMLCTTFYRIGKANEMERCAEDLKSSDPKALAESYFIDAIAKIYKTESDPEGGYKSASAALEIYPENVAFLMAKTIAAEKLKKTSEALEISRKAVELEPFYAASHMVKGMLEIDNNNYTQAIEDLEYSFYLNPESESTLMLAGMYLSANAQDKALEYALLSLKSKPRTANSVLAMETVSLFFADQFGYYNGSFVEDYGETRNMIVRMRAQDSTQELLSDIGIDHLKNYLKVYRRINNPTQEQIDNLRLRMEIGSSWYRAVAGNKDQCGYKSGKSPQEIIAAYKTIGKSTSEAVTDIYVTAALDCTCQSDYRDNNAMKECIRTKEAELCGEGKKLGFDGNCAGAE